MSQCPVCHRDDAKVSPRDHGNVVVTQCSKCGKYEVTESAITILSKGGLRASERNVAALTHWIRSSQNRQHLPRLDSSNFEQIAGQPLPNPHEQADNFILWLGNRTKETPGQPTHPNYDAVAAIVGGVNGIDAEYVAKELLRSELLVGDLSSLNLTLAGWSRFDELTRSIVDSRLAFMAMPFGDKLLDHIFVEYWKPAVEQTGFELRRIDENQTAGLIDDRLRVEIRRSRFLISELTGQNQGTYWEAGFAEGLGRPVIYTCETSEFEKTHFDSNHFLTIVWDKDDLEKASENLKACIRETLPGEATMSDHKE